MPQRTPRTPRAKHNRDISAERRKVVTIAEHEIFNALLDAYQEAGLGCADCVLTRLLALVCKFALSNARGADCVGDVIEDMGQRTAHILSEVIDASRDGRLGEEMEAVLAEIDRRQEAVH